MSEISATFEVNAGHSIDVTADTKGLTLDQIAEMLYERDPGISLCHECAHEINEPESGDLIGFTVDGVAYEPDGDGWKVAPN